jgi:hypothetical protein
MQHGLDKGIRSSLLDLSVTHGRNARRILSVHTCNQERSVRVSNSRLEQPYLSPSRCDLI